VEGWENINGIYKKLDLNYLSLILRIAMPMVFQDKMLNKIRLGENIGLKLAQFKSI
jgi:hypothetical protein